MNPFERHGIEHLSPSSINTFTAAPAMFVLEKLLNRRQGVGPAAHRGSAVESGIAFGLMTGADLGVCINEAITEFDKKTALMADPRTDKERAGIAGMVERGLDELRPYGVPSSVQGRVEYKVDGLAVPVIGFYDLEFEQHGKLFDLKTTHALPSEIKRAHAKQVALYTACRGNHQGVLTYVTPKKVASYALENPAEHLAALVQGALAIQRFLSISADAMELAGLIMPDLESFYWSDKGARAAAFDVWRV